MSHKAARARRDTSERAIVDVLKARGFCVEPVAQKGLPDLIVWRAGRPEMWWIECKTGAAKLRATQDWTTNGLPVTVLRSAEDAWQWNR